MVLKISLSFRNRVFLGAPWGCWGVGVFFSLGPPPTGGFFLGGGFLLGFFVGLFLLGPLVWGWGFWGGFFVWSLFFFFFFFFGFCLGGVWVFSGVLWWFFVWGQRSPK